MAFDILLDKLKTEVLSASPQPLFEIMQKPSSEWKSTVAGMVACDILLLMKSYFE